MKVKKDNGSDVKCLKPWNTMQAYKSYFIYRQGP